ncbi:MAG TPA: basic secretory protein-like protein [Pirellulales bacterium]|nr:basic secretory protein-like protein [Pirellulales bacterium]
MYAVRPVILAALLVLFACAAAPADVKTAVNRNDAAAASGEFKFKDVPSPSRTDAGNKAKLTIIEGQPDPNGGDVERLTDGRLPSDADQPGANFFFAPGTEGGRLLLDLGSELEIKAVNTYSWHTNTRGPQVYKLYGGDAALADFIAKRERGADLEKAGWKLIASVDTRPKEGEPGGQYGVSISDSGDTIGKYRYLLFEVSRTQSGTPFGNTFFSEIDVDDGVEHAPPPEPAPIPLDVIKVADKYEIAFDLSQTPELKEWVDAKLKPVCAKWYPMIVEMLPSEGYTAPERFTIVFHKDMRGVANASGRRINCAAPWFKRNLDGEAVGAVVHEMVHIVQQYRRARGGNRNPGWMVEGLADYIRWFLYEPEDKRPRPNPARAKYTDSYRTTAAFLAYVKETHDKELIKKFNTAMREGKYSADLWKDYTGKTADDLWADYVKTLTQ